MLLLWQNNFKTKTNFSTSFIFYNTPSQAFLTFKGQRDTRNRNSNLEKWHGIKSCPYSLYPECKAVIFIDNVQLFWTHNIQTGITILRIWTELHEIMGKIDLYIKIFYNFVRATSRIWYEGNITYQIGRIVFLRPVPLCHEWWYKSALL